MIHYCLQYSTSGAVPGNHHRRTASSVIETLQTLTCNGAGDGTVDKRDEHIAAFLENLKKEQQASPSLNTDMR